MSFARFSDSSDVYIFEHVSGYIQCCGCSIAKPKDDNEIFGFAFANLKTPREALLHLDKHIDVGDKVPTWTFQLIRDEYPDLDVAIEPYVQSEEEKERTQRLWDTITKRSSDD
jgi:hypothetical protein